jgi:hypothetical protein
MLARESQGGTGFASRDPNDRFCEKALYGSSRMSASKIGPRAFVTAGQCFDPSNISMFWIEYARLRCIICENGELLQRD